MDGLFCSAYCWGVRGGDKERKGKMEELKERHVYRARLAGTVILQHPFSLRKNKLGIEGDGRKLPWRFREGRSVSGSLHFSMGRGRMP